MAKFKIVQDRGACIGCGACTAVCDNWLMDDDGKASPKKTELSEIGCNQKALEACPLQLIKIVKTK